MPRKRKKVPTPEELKRLDRQRRIAEAWMAGSTINDIAKAERISVHTVRGDLEAARDVVLPSGTREQLLGRNFARLEEIIAANAEGVKRGEDTATRNHTKAIAEQNRMLGVNGATNGGVSFTVNADKRATHGIRVVFTAPDPSLYKDDPLQREPQSPRLIEYKPISAPAPDVPLNGAPAKSFEPAPEPVPQRPPTYPEDDSPPVQRRRIQWEQHQLFRQNGFSPTDRTEFDNPAYVEENVTPWHKRKLKRNARRKG
jgi:hypothetical protein